MSEGSRLARRATLATFRVATLPLRRGPVHFVLMYHSHGSFRWDIPIREFERQLGYLTEHRRLVRLCDLPEALKTADTVVTSVTFDDGRIENYDSSLGALEAVGVKATFFLPSSLLGRTLDDGPNGAATYMSPSQAKELVAMGHEVGSHSLSHGRLTRIDRDRAWEEIDASKRALEDLVQAPVTSFAYPYGASDPEVRRLVGRAGYAIGTGNFNDYLRGSTGKGSLDWMDLPRLHSDTKLSWEKFETMVSSPAAWSLYSRLGTTRGRVQRKLPGAPRSRPRPADIDGGETSDSP